MNLELRKKEIADRLEEIRGLADSETDVSKLEALDKETDELVNERAALDKKLSMKTKFDRAMKVDTRNVVSEDEEMEKRGQALKEGRSVTIATTGVILPAHQANELGAYPFREISTLVDQVKVVNLEGGETYKKSFVKSHATGGLTAEGAEYTTTEPTFGYATISKVKITAYAEITEELEKLPALPYAQEVLNGITIALKKKLSEQILKGAGTTNTFKGIFASNVEALADNTDLEISSIDANTLDNIIYAYGGDEEVEGGAALILSKNDLRAFNNLKTTEGRKVHTIDYKAHTIDGIPYVINSNCGSIADPTTTVGTYCIAYGSLQNYEVPVFSPVDIQKSTDYKFKDGIICYKGSVFTGGNVTGYKGFIRIKKCAAPVANGGNTQNTSEEEEE